jgi:hypothetical protein
MWAATPVTEISLGRAPGPIVIDSQFGKLHSYALRDATRFLVASENSIRIRSAAPKCYTAEDLDAILLIIREDRTASSSEALGVQRQAAAVRMFLPLRFGASLTTPRCLSGQ